MNSSIKLIMIEMAVDLFLRDLREDAGRAMRNLIDVGMRFAKGSFRNDFLPYAQAMMSDPSCPYYHLLENVAHNVDGRALRTFGINLGYHAWTCGTAAMRESERRTGRCLPWCLIFDFREGGALSGSLGELGRIVSECRDLGIAAFVFFADPRSFPIDALALQFQDCAFFLFAEPASVDARLVAGMRSARNIACSLHAPFSNPDSAQEAAGLLARGGCLFGFHAWYENADELSGYGGSWLGHCERDCGTFAFFVRGVPAGHESAAAAAAFVARMRTSPEHGVFAADFCEDFAAIDRMTGGSPCFAVVRGDGSIGRSLGEKNGLPASSGESFRERLLRAMPAFGLR
jgi:hypothetical protein